MKSANDLIKQHKQNLWDAWAKGGPTNSTEMAGVQGFIQDLQNPNSDFCKKVTFPINPTSTAEVWKVLDQIENSLTSTEAWNTMWLQYKDNFATTEDWQKAQKTVANAYSFKVMSSIPQAVNPLYGTGPEGFDMQIYIKKVHLMRELGKETPEEAHQEVLRQLFPNELKGRPTDYKDQLGSKINPDFERMMDNQEGVSLSSLGSAIQAALMDRYSTILGPQARVGRW